MSATNKHLRRVLLCICLPMLLLLAACDTSGNTNGTTSPSPTATVGISTPPPSTGGVKSTPGSGTGPIIITTPTVLPGSNGQGQVVTLSDRMLVIEKVSSQAGTDPTSTAVSITITVKSTSAKAILNQASYFQVVGAEGDAFGTQSTGGNTFFSPIAPHLSHSGTLIFQVPTGAIRGGLRLLYRSEVATETVFVVLHL